MRWRGAEADLCSYKKLKPILVLAVPFLKFKLPSGQHLDGCFAAHSSGNISFQLTRNLEAVLARSEIQRTVACKMKMTLQLISIGNRPQLDTNTRTCHNKIFNRASAIINHMNGVAGYEVDRREGEKACDRKIHQQDTADQRRL